MSFLGSALGSVVSGLFGLAGGALQSHSASAQAEKEAQLQRENWEYAQKNAHQFEVQDLRAAGLNPILSATKSQLASMPAVSMPSGPSAYGNLGPSVASSITSALENERKKDEIKLESEKVKLEQERVRLLGESTASGISLNEKQMDKLDNDILLANKSYALQERLAVGTLREKEAICEKMAAEARKLISDSDLLNTEKEALSDKMKYGYLIASYFPKDLRDLVHENIVTWTKNHSDDIEDFVKALSETKSDSDVKDLVEDLFRFEIKRDPNWHSKLWK